MSAEDRRRVSESEEDKIVLVMGPTGTGKSTFINCATRQDGSTVGHSWRSHTAGIRSIRAAHPTDNHHVVFVDTPGFDDTFKSDIEILSIIADWLVKTYKRNFKLARILYFHMITETRMSGSAMKNLKLFSALCGQNAMPNVIVVTTMWGEATRAAAVRREQDLTRDVWGEMLRDGCSVRRFEDTYESAWNIVGSLQDRTQVLLPCEIVDIRLRLNETQAGIALNKELEKLIKDRKHAARILQGHTENQDDEQILQELNARQAEIEEKIRQTVDQLQVCHSIAHTVCLTNTSILLKLHEGQRRKEVLAPPFFVAACNPHV